MNVNPFDSLGDRIEMSEDDLQESDSRYEVNEPESIPHRLTFVLFDEIQEHSSLQSRQVIFDNKRFPKDQELLDSIREQGIVAPITVREIDDEDEKKDPFLTHKPGERKFALVSGHRRVAAGKAAGLTGTEGIVLKPDEDPELITMAENLGRRELSTYEKALALKSLQERRTLSGRQVAKVTGLSRTHVNRLLNTLKSPKMLQSLWQNGELSATAVITLKDHWKIFSTEKNKLLYKQIQNLTQNDADELAGQLDAGISLDAALKTVENLQTTPSKHESTQSRGDISKQSETDEKEQNLISDQKDPIISAIRDVFPKITKEQGKILFDHAIIHSVKDVDTYWASALYVAKGGDVDQAVELCSKAMANRTAKSLMKREVKTRKRVSAFLKKKKQKKDIKKVFKTIFPGC